MLCCAVLCCAVPCPVATCTALRRAAFGCAVPCRAVLCCTDLVQHGIVIMWQQCRLAWHASGVGRPNLGGQRRQLLGLLLSWLQACCSGG